MHFPLHAGAVGGAMGALLVTVAALAATDLPIPAPVRQVAEQHITAAALAAPVRFLADDALRGRAPASEGDTLTRLYLSTQLQALGYEAGGEGGSWQQMMDMVGVEALVPASWQFTGRGGAVDLTWHDEFIAASGMQQPSVAVQDAEVVFVGYGIQAPEYRWDDYKGVDLKGKVVLMLNNDPDWDPKLFEGNRRLYYGRWDYKYESAARQGAVAAIIIHTRPSAGYPWQVVQTSWSGEQFELPYEGEPRLQVRAWATEDATRKLLKSVGQDLDKLTAAARSRSFRPVPLGLRTSLRLDNKISKVQTGNVIGVLPGSDPVLKHEYVIFTAHHDHLGVGEPDASGDRIYNGAMDNAAGCAQLLAMARAFAALPQRPRRSIMMLFVGAEEQGLLGSKYYSRHPTVAPGRMAANINYDGGNIWGRTRDATMIGLGKSTLDDVARQVTVMQGRRLEPDQFPDRGYYYRSDQFSFARIGVPALYFENGTDVLGKPEGWGKKQIEEWEGKHYHQPSDQLDASWTFDGLIEDAQLGFYAGWLVGEADAMPRWRAGDEFEAARLAALRAVSIN